MQDFHGMHTGDLRLENDMDLYGMVVGNVVVPTGKYLILHGMITGDLKIESGARMVVHGMVQGAVLNLGGDVTIFGMVEIVDDQGPTKTKIMAGAMISKSKRLG